MLKKISVESTKNIEITYPKNESEHLLSNQKIKLKTKNKDVFWYVNDHLLDASK